ncbi:hypothetical protein [Streptomyces sp. NPDC058086]|uniref:hypothetical protein n=1 Tax=Streptomyces sp. NPDC058086 TaxID=3346334 RepID=UPI0036EB65A9
MTCSDTQVNTVYADDGEEVWSAPGQALELSGTSEHQVVVVVDDVHRRTSPPAALRQLLCGDSAVGRGAA